MIRAMVERGRKKKKEETPLRPQWPGNSPGGGS